MPEGQSVNSTSIFTTSALFEPVTDDNPETAPRGSPGPFRYNVTKTGYCASLPLSVAATGTKDGTDCVGTVPVSIGSAGDDTDPLASSVQFNGVVDFENVFEGHLPATEWPKIPFYFGLAIVYAIVGLIWGFLCWRNWQEILGIQVRRTSMVWTAPMRLTSHSITSRRLSCSSSSRCSRYGATGVI